MESIYCGTTPKSGIVTAQNKDFEMSSTLEKARRNIKIAGIFAVLSLGMVANSNAKTPLDNDIELFTDDPGAKDAPSGDKPVPGKDLRQRTQTYAELKSGQLSSKGVVILYSGTSQDVFEQIRMGAADAKIEGAEVLGVVWGPPSGEYISYYAGGGIAIKPDGNTTDIRSKVKNQCIWASEEYLAKSATNKTTTYQVAGVGQP